jgi:putative ABC transport system permease protein
VLLCFAFVSGSLLSAYFLVGGAENSLRVGTARMGADSIVVPQEYAEQGEAVLLTGQPSTFFMNASKLTEVSAIVGVESASPQLYIATLKDAPCCSLPVQLIGFDPSKDFTVLPWLQSELHRPLKQDEVVVGARIIGDIGSQLTFYGHNFTIAGRLEPTGIGLDTSVFTSMSDAYVMAAGSATLASVKLDIPPNEISAVLVKVDSAHNPDEVTSRIQAQVEGVKAISSSALLRTVESQLSGTTQLLYATTASVTLVSLPLIALVFSMATNERRREIGLMRAMGASKGFLFRLILVESLLLSALGGASGILTSSILLVSFQSLIVSSLKIPFLWPDIPYLLLQVGLSLLVAVGVGAAASAYPAFRIANLEPYEAIRGGEA